MEVGREKSWREGKRGTRKLLGGRNKIEEKGRAFAEGREIREVTEGREEHDKLEGGRKTRWGEGEETKAISLT